MKMWGALLILFTLGATAAPTKNIVELASSVPDLSTLVTAVKAAGLVETLEGAGPFTVFAPTNEAFGKLPKGTLEKLLKPENKAELAKILTYHVVAASAHAADLKMGEKLKTVEGDSLTVKVASSKVVLIEGGSAANVAKVTQADVDASNGVVHVIDHVFLPPTAPAPAPSPSPAPAPAPAKKNIVELAASVPDLSTLVTAVKAAGLVETLEGKGPFTVFAPTNEAFGKLPKGTLEKLLKPENKAELAKILTYHVVAASAHAADLKTGEKIKTVEGDSLTVKLASSKLVLIEGGSRANVARVIQADVDASNGVVHVIDHVFLPPTAPAPSPSPGPAPAPGKQNIVELASSVPELSTLVAAVKAAGLVDTLEGTGPFTVLAPSNDAFKKLPPNLLKYLLEPEHKAELAKLLTYHVIPGHHDHGDFKDHMRFKTVEGDSVEAYDHDGHVYIRGGLLTNFAEVEKADNEASNGVAHIISSVLIPFHHDESIVI